MSVSMEIPTNTDVYTANPRVEDDGGASMPPLPAELSAQGGMTEDLRAQGSMAVTNLSDREAVVPPGGSEIVGGNKEERKEEKEIVVVGDGDKGVAAPPLVESSAQYIMAEEDRVAVVLLEGPGVIERERERERAAGSVGDLGDQRVSSDGGSSSGVLEGGKDKSGVLGGGSGSGEGGSGGDILEGGGDVLEGRGEGGACSCARSGRDH